MDFNETFPAGGDNQEILSIINHVFLPPRLPNHEDCRKISQDNAILGLVISALGEFQCHVNSARLYAVKSAGKAMAHFQSIRDEAGFINRLVLGKTLNFSDEDKDITVPLHATAQNAGIIITKTQESVVVEAFELSPTNEAVMGTTGRLQRCFPASSISIPLKKFFEKGFTEALTETIWKLSYQEANEAKPRIVKRGEVQIEERDTTDPFLVTDFLNTVLLAHGGEAKPDAPISKNTREEVMWNNASMPWRRSPIWLLARVTLLLHFERRHSDRLLYKEFMIFLMSYTLDIALKRNLSSDVLYCMRARIARRLKKLGHGNEASWITKVHDTLERASARLRQRWVLLSLEPDADVDLVKLSRQTLPTDGSEPYSALDDFIRDIDSRKREKCPNQFRAPWTLRKYNHSSIPELKNLTEKSIPFHLSAFERWVDLSLLLWVRDADENRCTQLYNLAQTYYNITQECYSGCPESLSIASLTILEMWVACDKSACVQIPLIKEYSPEIPFELLQSLLLHSENHIERLVAVEKYIIERCSSLLPTSSSIFSSYGHENSFSVRYYATSAEHQALRKRIEQLAAEEREKKRKEFYDKRREYNDLMSLSAGLTCEYNDWVDPYTGIMRQSHSRSCRKEALLCQADALVIEIHEWPLPAKELEAESAVFELNVPSCFSAWRNMTTFVINDVLECHYSPSNKGKVVDRLRTYLSPHFTGGGHRFELASTTKSNNRTHRHGKKISTCLGVEAVLLENGLQYEYYDNVRECFVSHFFNVNRFTRSHMFKLSDPNSALQGFIFRPPGQENGLTPNHVLSEQHSYSQALSLEESKTMASLSIGYRLQWDNLLVQLFVPKIDFNKPDSVLIIMQIIHQAGPRFNCSKHRASHQQLCDNAFVERLLEGLSRAVDRIEKNWESYTSLRGFIAIAIKTLNCLKVPTLMEPYRQFLRRCRSVVNNWINLLQEKLPKLEDEEQKLQFYLIVSQMGMICLSSFDVDEKHLGIFLSDAEQMEIMVHSSIIIQHLSHSVGKCTEPFYINLLLQKQRVLYNSLKFVVAETLERMNPGLDSAVKTALGFYNGTGAWKILSDDDYHWLETETVADNGKSSLTVQINILTGELLVNGLPPSRLPTMYEAHPSFRELFGREMIEVMPSDIPGTSFVSMKRYHGHSFAFGMDHTDPPQIIIVASTDKETLDLVPRGFLNPNLPVSFTNDYVHWYHRQSGVVEFRSREVPWASLQSNWHLESTGSAWVLRRPGETLMCPTSSPLKRVCQTLRSLEEESHIHITRDETTLTLNIRLPRLRLDFSLEEGSCNIYCRQFRGMYVDNVQQIGTLVGLQSKLTLCDGQKKRIVIVPDGDAHYSGTSGHVQVEIKYGSSLRVHPFVIDTRLGRLVDNGSLQSKLCLAYLHALTSYCLPDQLTGKTGTEQCLSILNSAAVRSFQQLSKKDIDILVHISKLSPGRAYYPKEERVMETVEWNSGLSFLSQTGSLHNTVLSITKAIEEKMIFYTEQPVQYIIPNHVDERLGLRHLIRDSIFYTFGFGAENHTTSQDICYNSRDRVRRTERSRRAFQAAAMAVERRQTIHMPISPTFALDMWNLLNNRLGTQGANTPLPDEEVSYDCRWLSEASAYFAQYWCRFYNSFSNKQQPFCRFRLMFCVATMAYAEKHDVNAVQALVACANIPAIGILQVPNVNEFHMPAGYECDYSYLSSSLSNNYMIPFCSSPEASLPRDHKDESDRDLNERRRRVFNSKQNSALSDFTSGLQNQWVCFSPSIPHGADLSKYIHTTAALNHILPTWRKWYENRQLFDYLTTLGTLLRWITVEEIYTTSHTGSLAAPIPASLRGFINQEDLFNHCAPLLDTSSDSLIELLEAHVTHSEPHDQLKQLIDCLKQQASRDSEHRYIQDLDDSQNSHSLTVTSYRLKKEGEALSHTLKLYLLNCEFESNQIYRLLKKATGVDCEESVGSIDGHRASSASVASQFMAPRVTPTFFLGQLARENWKNIPLEWKRAVVIYAQSLTMTQRAERMFSLRDNDAELVGELLNIGHTNWDPMDYPESLLLEVESGIMIREVQENIASQMRSPSQGENATMQLNMGEGKSTVILPAVAGYLADGRRLLCVIGTKPQAKELFRMLTSKLGGLMNHQVYQMPFSRSLRFTVSDARRTLDMLKMCCETGGVLLMQPEHLLSFKLMGIENQLGSQGEVGQILLDVQHYLNTHSRTIVDESDEIFSVKFELIYTIGTQVSVDLGPDRWIIAQSVLSIVMRAVHSIRGKLPQSIEISHSRKGQFPRIRILRKDAEDMLLSQLAEEICNAGVPGLPIMRQPQAVRDSVREYILNSDLDGSQVDIVEVESGFFTDSTKGQLLLIRGLIAEGVLSFAFRQKRWKVNYGLDPVRVPKTRLAVPYRAKDNPSARSEFSHPDVVIILTSLTYYYGGLSDDDLFASFDHLSRANQAEVQYQDWVLDAPNLPKAFRSLTGVTMKDRHQAIHQIFPHFRYAKNAVDYFLSHIVFPNEMKEFPKKLSASGWDIGQVKTHPTTGFSGTCDSRNLMPLDIKHLDLPEQRHTNALVLRHILQSENSVVHVHKVDETQSSDAETILNLVISMEPPVQVILDVGAQILELTNTQLAKAWLKKVPESQGKKAVIYFDDHDELCVIDHQGCVEGLQSSPYSQQLDLCLVFLDEAHTRGTDLKLPTNYRAAVTLGPGLTKDRLVQACMRLRKLGRGQSVVFCIPEEIEARITTLTKGDDDSPIQVLDVLTWVIYETFIDLHRSIATWAVQGQRFHRQSAIWESATTTHGIRLHPEKASELLEAEIQALDDRYRPHVAHEQPFQPSTFDKNPRLEAIWKRCEEFGNTKLNSCLLWEEQEREISPEIERERQIERPMPIKPAKHAIHPRLIELVTSGSFSQSTPFFPAFEGLRNTSAGRLLEVSYFPDDVLITQDFMSTVMLEGKHDRDDFYQRSVQWILSQTLPDSSVQRLIIISPHEAQELKPLIAKSQHVYLHLYTPLPSLANPSLESLKLYTVPTLPGNWHLSSRLRILLNLFSGQLYIHSQDDYNEVCKLLNLSSGTTEDGVVVEPDGFMISQAGTGVNKFEKSPIMFLRALLAIRWNSEVNNKTHWGSILRGELLKEHDFPESRDSNQINEV